MASQAGDASLIFLIGGLAMLGVILLLVLLQALVPERRHAPAATPARRRFRRIPSHEATGAAPAAALAPTPGLATWPLDPALDRLVAGGHGEPRVLSVRPGRLLLRLHGCACPEGGGCTASATAIHDALRERAPGDERAQRRRRRRAPHGAALDPFTPGALAVREVACSRAGAASCEFEVTQWA